MEQKKATRAQLEKKIKNAQVFIGKAEKSIYFGDRGIGIYICKDEVLLKTNFHTHIWEKIISSNFSAPCMYLEQLVNIAHEHIKDITEKNTVGDIYYSFSKLTEIPNLSLAERGIVKMVVYFIYTVNESIFSIGNDKLSITKLLMDYILFTAKNEVYFNGRDNNKDADILQNDLYNSLIGKLRFLSLTADISSEQAEGLEKHILKEETKTYKNIKKYLESKGYPLVDVISIPKDTSDEAKALNEISH